MAKKYPPVSLKIVVKAGSEFQYDHARNLLDVMAKTLQYHFTSTHKGNNLEYFLSIDERDAEIVTKEEILNRI